MNPNTRAYHIGPYIVRQEPDDAGTLQWFAYREGDGPNRPSAAYPTLRAARADLARHLHADADAARA